MNLLSEILMHSPHRMVMDKRTCMKCSRNAAGVRSTFAKQEMQQKKMLSLGFAGW